MVSPRPPGLEELDPGMFDHGWQFFAARAVEERVPSSAIWPRLSPTEQALLRSQLDWAPLHGSSFLAHFPFLPRAACPRSGVLGSRGFPLARVSTYVFFQGPRPPGCQPRRPSLRGRCRQSALLRWCPARCGHHLGFSRADQRSPAPSMQRRMVPLSSRPASGNS